MTNRYKTIIQVASVVLTFVMNAATAQNNETSQKVSAITQTDEKQSFNEYKAVEQALQPYILAAKTGSADKLRTAFFDHAHIVGTVKGKFYNADLTAFQKSINSGGASPNVQHHIAWIDITGSAGAAKVEFIDWRGFRFTDYFVLFKHEGQWKISGKVYDSHSNK